MKKRAQHESEAKDNEKKRFRRGRLNLFFLFSTAVWTDRFSTNPKIFNAAFRYETITQQREKLK